MLFLVAAAEVLTLENLSSSAWISRSLRCPSAYISARSVDSSGWTHNQLLLVRIRPSDHLMQPIHKVGNLALFQRRTIETRNAVVGSSLLDRCFAFSHVLFVRLRFSAEPRGVGILTRRLWSRPPCVLAKCLSLRLRSSLALSSRSRSSTCFAFRVSIERR